MQMRKRQHLIGISISAHETWSSLSSIAETIEPTSTHREAFISECRSGAFDNVAAIYRTFASASITGNWDEELVNALPPSIQFCAHNGAGYDQIDVHACKERGESLETPEACFFSPTILTFPTSN